MHDEGSHGWLLEWRRRRYPNSPKRRDHWQMEVGWQKFVNSQVLGLMRLKSRPRNAPRGVDYWVKRIAYLFLSMRYFKLYRYLMAYELHRWKARRKLRNLP